jgi:peptide/nickel transport system permease protein
MPVLTLGLPAAHPDHAPGAVRDAGGDARRLCPFARARGVPERVIEFRHALKNTMVPVITIAGLQLGGVIAFAIVTETVFQWPGLGALFVKAVQFVDVPVMSAYLLFVAFVFVVTNLVVDLLYFALDPRLRGAGAAPAH